MHLHRWIAPVAALVFLVIVGLRPGTLPFFPGAQFSDAATSHWPAAEFLRESVLERGQYPLWRETIMAGHPFAANPLNKTAYPLQWMALLLPPALHLNVMILLHIFIGAMGVFTWVRAEGVSRTGAAIGALAYAVSPKLMVYLAAGHLDITYAMAWWPWLLWSIKTAMDEKPGLAPALRTTVIAGLLFLADVRLSLYALTTALIYGVWLAATHRDWKRAAWHVAGAPVFLALVAALLVPLMMWRPYMSRSTITPEAVADLSLQPLALISLILPANTGSFENLTYLGLGVLVLAGVGLFTLPRRDRFFWGGLGLGAALYALGPLGPLWPLAIRIAPFLLWFRVPARAWFVLNVVVVLLAAHGVDAMMRARLETDTDDKPKERSLGILRMVTVGGAGLVASAGGFAAFAIAPLRGPGIVALFNGVALGVLLMTYLAGRLAGQRLFYALLAVLFVDFALTGAGRLEWRGPGEWLVPHAPLAERLVELEARRVYSPSYALPQEVAEAYDLSLFGGVDPFQLTGFVTAMEAASGIPVEAYTVVLPPLNDIESDADIPFANRDATPDVTLLGEWGVSHVIAAYDIEASGLELADTVDEVNIYGVPSVLSGATVVFQPDAFFSPRWPDTPDLPTISAIASFHSWTLVAAVLSTVSFVFSVGFLLFRRR